ncbi:MAG: hypothetical protein RJA36_795 [Pseudomonadota bacterium]|jgi:DNA (cytosine-5)-methyltransferase 1
MTLRELHLFAGIGGGILGGLLLGHRCVGAVEIDPYCRRVLETRQRDGILESFPIHDDIRTFDGTAWRDRVDVVAGGFPCQDISEAGKRAGLDGARSGLWWEMLRVIREVGPRYVFVENVAGLLVRGLDRVLGSLAELGFDAEWCVRSAADVGAPHRRKRLWLLARSADAAGCGFARDCEPHGEACPGIAASQRWDDADGLRAAVANATNIGRVEGRDALRSRQPDAARHGDAGDADRARLAQRQGQRRDAREQQPTAVRAGWATEPRVGRVAHGVPARVDRLRSLGNSQVPAVAATAFAELMDRFGNTGGG